MTAPAAFRPVEVRRGPLVAWLLALAAGIAAMLWLGEGHLATPRLADPGAWGTWLQQRDPLVAAMAVFRLLVLAIAWYLVGVTGVSLVAHVARAARLVRLADALAVPVVRRVTQQAVGITLATAAVATVSHAPSPHDLSPPIAAGASLSIAASQETVAMQALVPETLAMTAEAPETAAMTRLSGPDDAPDAAYTLRMERLTGGRATDDATGATEAPPVADAPATPTHAAPPASSASSASSASAGVDDTHVVAPGDHLWSIAEDVLATAWGRPPTDREIEPYWRALVEENRPRLSNPDDPDLLLPGQTLTLPAPPVAP